MRPIFGRLGFPLEEEADPNKGGGGDDGKKASGGEADLGTIEERAARMGWVPKDKFRGDPEKWTDAATFVKNGEESLPILRERLRAKEAENLQLSKSLGEFKKMSDTAFARAYEKAKRELEEKIESAAEAGGEDGKKAAKAATKELGELEGEKARRDAAAQDDPVFDVWVADNHWYTDAELKIEAEAIAFKLRKRGVKLEGAEFLDKVKEEMKKQFPEKFGNPRRQAGGGQTERPNAGGEDSATRGKKGWEQLPAEAKEAGERYVKQKLYKDKAAYAEAYWAQQ